MHNKKILYLFVFENMFNEVGVSRIRNCFLNKVNPGISVSQYFQELAQS